MKYLKIAIIALLVAILVGPYLTLAQDSAPQVPSEIIIKGNLRDPDHGSPYQKGVYTLECGLYSSEACEGDDLVHYFGSFEVEITAHKVKDDEGVSKFDAAFELAVDTSGLPNDLIAPLWFKYIESTIGGYEVIPITSDLFAIISQKAVTIFDEDNNVYKSPTKVKPDKSKCAELVKDDQTTEECIPAREVYVDEAKNAHTVDYIHAINTLYPNPETDADKLVVYGAISTEIDERIADHTEAYGHLSTDDKTDLTDGGDTTLHYHSSDRDLANATGILDKSHLDSSQIQRRVTGTCGAGSSIRVINEDGSVVCEPDDVNDAVSNPSGTYNSMTVGYANTLTGKDLSVWRDCCQICQYEGTDPGDWDLACILWPWDEASCKKMVCDRAPAPGPCRSYQWNTFYSDGTFVVKGDSCPGY